MNLIERLGTLGCWVIGALCFTAAGLQLDSNAGIVLAIIGGTWIQVADSREGRAIE